MAALMCGLCAACDGPRGTRPARPAVAPSPNGSTVPADAPDSDADADTGADHDAAHDAAHDSGDGADEALAACTAEGGVCLAGFGCPDGYVGRAVECSAAATCCVAASCTAVASGRCLPTETFERSGGCGAGLAPAAFAGCDADTVCCVPVG